MANVGLPPQPQNQPAENPIMGLFLDRPAHTMDPKAFSACNNVRIELGRVRSDLIGWAAATPSLFPASTSTQPYIYLDSFTNSVNDTIQIGVTPTDILKIGHTGSAPFAAAAYITPTYNTGTIAVNNGSTTVTGTNTRWATDIGGGTDSGAIVASSAAGALSISVSAVTLATWQAGTLIQCNTTPAAIAPGTFISNIAGGAVYLSKPLQASVTNTDTVVVGSSVNLRNNVRIGDQIAFGTTAPGNVGALTWYTVTAIASDTSLTISPAYSGTNLSGSTYVVRQILTDTINVGSPSLPLMASDSYLFAGGFNGYPVNALIVAQNKQTGDQWFFTNGIDPVAVFYSGTGGSLYTKTVPFTVTTLKQFRGLMVYGGITSANPNSTVLSSSITSSDSGFPQQLNTGVAFQGIAVSGPFKISRMAILGSTLMLYSILGNAGWTGGADNVDNESGAVTSASFVGFPTIWSFSDVIQTRGAISGNAVAVFPDRHQFLSVDAEYRYNGLFVQIMNDHIWRQVLKSYDSSRASSVISSTIPTFGDLIWAIPQTTDPPGQLFAATAFAEAYMEQANSYLFKPFTQRDFPFWASAAFQLTASNQITYYASDHSGKIYQLYISNTQAGTPALCTVTWGSRPIGNGRNRVLVTRVYPEVEYMGGGGSINVTLTMQDAAAGPTTITDTQTFNPNYSGNRFTTHYRRGRQAAVTISDTAGLGWICQGYDWDYTLGGVR